MSNPYNSATERASVLGPTLYFKGDLSAEKSVFVKDTAKICGNIISPSVSISEGASFSGSIDMDGKKPGQTLGKPEAAAGRLLKASTGAV